MRRLKKIVILGKPYKIIYTKCQLDTDADRAEPLLGQLHQNSHTIRVYAGPTFGDEEVLDTLIHEITHRLIIEIRLLRDAIGDETNIESFIHTFASVLADTLIRNKMVK